MPTRADQRGYPAERSGGQIIVALLAEAFELVVEPTGHGLLVLAKKEYPGSRGHLTTDVIFPSG